NASYDGPYRLARHNDRSNLHSFPTRRSSDLLTIMEKLFLVEIDSLDNDKGCFASNAHFAEFFGITKGRCTQIIKSLEKKGLVTIKLEREGMNESKRIIKVVRK